MITWQVALVFCVLVLHQTCHGEKKDTKSSVKKTRTIPWMFQPPPVLPPRLPPVNPPMQSSPWQRPTFPSQFLPIFPVCQSSPTRDNIYYAEMPSVLPVPFMCGVSTPHVKVPPPVPPPVQGPVNTGGCVWPFTCPGKRQTVKRNSEEDLDLVKRVVSAPGTPGGPSPSGLWPWTVSLTRQGGHFCTGSLISTRWVLTAAHCFNEREFLCNIRVMIGETNILNAYNKGMNVNFYAIDRIIRHGNYINVGGGFDIALVRLAQHVATSLDVGPICLQDPRETHIPGTCYIQGWGKQHAQQQGQTYQLQHANVGLIGTNTCQLYSGSPMGGRICINNMPGFDACNGDSGGPLVCGSANRGNWIQLGITSYGTAAATGCGTKGYMPTMWFHTFPFPSTSIERGYPTVFTNVGSYMLWIQSVIARYGGSL